MVFSLEIFNSFRSAAACKMLKLINLLIQTPVRTPTTPTPPQQLIAQLDTDPVKNIEKIKEYFSSTEVKTILMNEGNDALLAKIKTLAPPPITYPPPPTSGGKGKLKTSSLFKCTYIELKAKVKKKIERMKKPKITVSALNTKAKMIDFLRNRSS